MRISFVFPPSASLKEKKKYYLVTVLVEQKDVEKGVKPLKEKKKECGRKCGEKKRFSTAQTEKNSSTFCFQLSTEFCGKEFTGN